MIIYKSENIDIILVLIFNKNIMGARIIVNKGDKYNKLTIIKEINEKIDNQGRIIRKCKCKCICGNIIETYLKNLRTGHIKSCGCIAKKNRSIAMKKTMTKHGMKGTIIYGRFDAIKSRCNNSNNINYKNYGARGIKCEWKTFEEFYKDMKKDYKSNLQIDRIDNNGNYNKKNCRWITAKENNRNRRNTIMYKGISLGEWCEKLGLKYHTVYDRLNRYGYSFEKALEIN